MCKSSEIELTGKSKNGTEAHMIALDCNGLDLFRFLKMLLAVKMRQS